MPRLRIDVQLFLQVSFLVVLLAVVLHMGSVAPEPLDSLFLTVAEVLPDEAKLFNHSLHLVFAAHRGSRAPFLRLTSDLTANAVLVSAALPGSLDLGLNLCEPFLFRILLLAPARVGFFLPLGILFLIDVRSSSFRFDAE